MNDNMDSRAIGTPTVAARSSKLLLVAVSLVISVLTAACGDAGPASTSAADTEGADKGLPFVATLTFRIISNEQQGDQTIIEAKGRGTSDTLGAISATAMVVETASPPCERAIEDHVWSTDDGTLDISADVQVCGADITGTWEVTGGTGKFSAASGGGTESGRFESSGVVIEYEGNLSI